MDTFHCSSLLVHLAFPSLAGGYGCGELSELMCWICTLRRSRFSGCPTAFFLRLAGIPFNQAELWTGLSTSLARPTPALGVSAPARRSCPWFDRSPTPNNTECHRRRQFFDSSRASWISCTCFHFDLRIITTDFDMILEFQGKMATRIDPISPQSVCS